MEIRVARTVQELEALALPWQALEQQVPGVLPFQTYDWNRAWWEVFAVVGRVRHDHLHVCAFWVEGRLVGVLPLFRSVYGLGPLALFSYKRPLGADPNLTEIRDPLALPAYRETLMAHWMDMLLAASQRYVVGLVFAQEALLNAASAPVEAGQLHCINQRVIPNFVLDLPDDWEVFRSGLKRNIKESLRRCYNSLNRDQLRHELVVLSDSHQILAQLPLFYQLHSTRAARTDTVSHPDYFNEPAHRAFIHKLVADASGPTPMRMLCLRIDGRTVAMRLAFEQGPSLYLYYSGYDPAFGKYSVMTTLVAETLRWAIGRGLKQVNLSIGEDVSKTRWGPRELRYAECTVTATGLKGKLISWLVQRVKR